MSPKENRHCIAASTESDRFEYSSSFGRHTWIEFWPAYIRRPALDEDHRFALHRQLPVLNLSHIERIALLRDDG